jgi:hypothetical protein
MVMVAFPAFPVALAGGEGRLSLLSCPHATIEEAIMDTKSDTDKIRFMVMFLQLRM